MTTRRTYSGRDFKSEKAWVWFTEFLKQRKPFIWQSFPSMLVFELDPH